MGIQINADSPGERIVVGLAILGMLAELTLHPSCHPPPISVDRCVALCAPEPVSSFGASGCVCAREAVPGPDGALARIGEALLPSEPGKRLNPDGRTGR